MIDEIGNDFLQKLRGFYYVAKSGSFSVAAAELGKNQATVSRYVKSLEEKFNVPLFERTRRGTFLTSQGELLLRQTEAIFKSIRKMEFSLQNQVTQLDGNISIASYHSILQNWLHPSIVKFSHDYPQVSFTLEGGATRATLKMVRSSEADFAILDLNETPPDLSFVDLFVTRMVLIVPKNQEPVLGTKPTLTEIAKLPQIAYPMYSTTTPRVQRRFSQLGLQMNVKMTTNNYQAIKLFTRVGMGVAFIDEYQLTEEDREVFRIYPLDEYFEESKFGLVFKKSKHFSPSLQAFIKSLKPDFRFKM